MKNKLAVYSLMGIVVFCLFIMSAYKFGKNVGYQDGYLYQKDHYYNELVADFERLQTNCGDEDMTVAVVTGQVSGDKAIQVLCPSDDDSRTGFMYYPGDIKG